MSTPIINPPQTAILGMHVTKERPMAVNGEVVILPMMYLALSYDHRLIDGNSSYSLLVTIKELVEMSQRRVLLLDAMKKPVWQPLIQAFCLTTLTITTQIFGEDYERKLRFGNYQVAPKAANPATIRMSGF